MYYVSGVSSSEAIKKLTTLMRRREFNFYHRLVKDGIDDDIYINTR